MRACEPRGSFLAHLPDIVFIGEIKAILEARAPPFFETWPFPGVSKSEYGE
jgi:hypothetical protein